MKTRTTKRPKKKKSRTQAKATSKGKESGPKRRKTMLDAAIYVCASLVLVGCICLGYLGVGGGFHNQRILALFITYITLFFVLTGGFLYFYQRLLVQQSAGAFLEVTSAKVFRGRINKLSETGEPGRLMARAQIIAENAELLAGDTPIAEVTITNTGSAIAKSVRGIALVNFGPMIGENPDYSAGDQMHPLQSVTDLAKGQPVIYSVPSNGVLTAQDVRDINEFRRYVFIYGYVTYLDGDKQRTMKFCYLYNPRTYRLGQCPTHNSVE